MSDKPRNVPGGLIPAKTGPDGAITFTAPAGSVLAKPLYDPEEGVTIPLLPAKAAEPVDVTPELLAIAARWDAERKRQLEAPPLTGSDLMRQVKTEAAKELRAWTVRYARLTDICAMLENVIAALEADR